MNNNKEQIELLLNITYVFLNKFKSEKPKEGRYILENGCYANVQSYLTNVKSKSKYESHKKYIDIQMILEGEEIITVAPVNQLKCVEPYDEEKDIIFYDNNFVGTDYFLSTGDYIILYPGDGHMPCISINHPIKVKKVVVKVPIKLFSIKE